MANLIQIKRSLNTAVPTQLANGELAFTANGDVLYIGSNGAIEAIGGKRTPGVLTANQALVANSTGFIDQIKTSNLTATAIIANGSMGSANQILYSDGTGIYWANDVPTVAGSNTQVQFNDSGDAGATADFTFDKATKTLTSANAIQTQYLLGINGARNITTNYGSVNGAVGISTDLHVGVSGTGGNVVANGYFVGNGAYVTSVNAAALGGKTEGNLNVNNAVTANDASYLGGTAAANYVTNTGNYTLSGNITFAGSQLVINNGTTIVANGTSGTADQVLSTNGTSIYWADPGSLSTVTANTLQSNTITINETILVGNSTVNVSVNSTSISVSNSSSSLTITPLGIDGAANSATYVKANNGIVSNSSGVFAYGANGISVDSSGINVTGGTGVSVNTSGVHIGQPVGTTDSVTFNDITATGNVSLGATSDDVITLNGLVNTHFIPAANNTYNLGNNSLRWNDLYLAGTTIYLGNSTISSSSGTVQIGNIELTTATIGDLTVNGNTVIGNATSDVISFIASVNTSINPSANVTYNLGTNTMRWNEIHASNVHSIDGYFEGNVDIAGNLVVSGNVITTNVSSVIVSDPLIYLAGNNYVSDLVDIGFVGNYHQGGTDKHTGVFRHAATDQYYIFKGLTQELDNVLTINIADPSFALADVNAYLLSGGLVSNAGSVAITANSTVNVNIVANTLTLSTPLAGNSGGTGLNSFTAEDILVANSSNGFRKLGLGTDGYVLQSNGSALVYDTLDGGTF